MALVSSSHFLLSLNTCRLGFLVDFLSHAALVGFMAGAAVIIGLQQLKGLLGISHFTSKTDVVSVLASVYKSLHHQIASGEKVSPYSCSDKFHLESYKSYEFSSSKTWILYI